MVGRTNTYTVVLEAQPAGPVTVLASLPNIVAEGPTESPESRTLVFTAGNWQTAQGMKVTGGRQAM